MHSHALAPDASSLYAATCYASLSKSREPETMGLTFGQCNPSLSLAPAPLTHSKVSGSTLRSFVLTLKYIIGVSALRYGAPVMLKELQLFNHPVLVVILHSTGALFDAGYSLKCFQLDIKSPFDAKIKE